MRPRWHKEVRRVRKRLWRVLREPPVRLCVFLVASLLPSLSRRGLLRLARVLGALVMALDGRGRRVAAANVRVLFGVRATPRRTRILVAGSYRLAAQVALDVFWFARRTRDRVETWTSLDPVLGVDLVSIRPALVVAAHYGNWEIMLLAAAGLARLPWLVVVKEQWSPAITALLNRQRCALGGRVVFPEGALRVMLKELRAGGVVGFLLDQHTGPHEGGLWVDFGGLPATVSGGPALLARRAPSPVLLVTVRAFKNGRYVLASCARMCLAENETDTAFTQRMIDGLVRAVRRHPSQWMLMYRRWTPVAPGDDPTRYPFYAKFRPARVAIDTVPSAGQST